MKVHKLELKEEFKVGRVTVRFAEGAGVKFYNHSGVIGTNPKQSKFNDGMMYVTMEIRSVDTILIEEGIGMNGVVEFSNLRSVTCDRSTFDTRPREAWGLPLAILSKQYSI